MDADRLPTYQQATSAEPASQQKLEVLPTLVLQGSKISSLEQPQNIFYELNSAPAEAATHKYDIYKLCKNRARAGELRRLHIYTCTAKTSFSLFSPRHQIVIEGKSKREGTCQEVTLTTKSSKWDNCSTHGLFTASTSKLDRFKNFGGLTWLKMSGNIVALESQIAAQDGYLPSTESRLNIQEALSAAELDLLIACWMARFVMDMRYKTEASRPSASGKFTIVRLHSLQIHEIANSLNGIVSILRYKQRNVKKLGAGNATFL